MICLSTVCIRETGMCTCVYIVLYFMDVLVHDKGELVACSNSTRSQKPYWLSIIKCGHHLDGWLKHPACTVGWAAQLCESWLSLGKVIHFSHGRNPIVQNRCKQKCVVAKEPNTDLSPSFSNFFALSLSLPHFMSPTIFLYHISSWKVDCAQ